MGKVFQFPKTNTGKDDPNLVDTYARLERILTDADLLSRGPEYMSAFLTNMLIMSVHGMRTLGDDESATKYLHLSLQAIEREPNFKHSLFQAIETFWLK